MATQYKVEFTAEVNEAISAIQQLSKESTKQLENIETQSKQTAKATSALFALEVAKVGIGILSDFGSAVVSSLGDAVDAAIESENAIAGLNAALEQSGQFTQETSEELQNFAKQLQNTTKFEDDAIISATGYLATLTKLDKDGLKKATQASADLASALRIDLQSATELVAKASEGNTSALKRYGIEVQKGKDDTETFANTLEVLNSKFGGRAEKDVNTYSGAIAQVKNTFGDVSEEIGTAIITNDELISVIKTVQKTVTQFQPEIQLLAKLIGEALTGGITLAVKSFGYFLEATAIAVNTVLDLKDTILVLGDTFNKIVKLTTGFVAGLTGTRDAQKEVSNAVLEDIDAINKNAKAREESTKKSKASIDAFIISLNASIDKTYEQTLAEKKNATDYVTGSGRKIASVKEVSEEQSKALKESLDKITKDYENAGKTQVQILEATSKEQQKVVDDAAKQGLTSYEDAYDLRLKIAESSEKKITEARLKEEDEANKKSAEAYKKFVDGVNSVLNGINTVLNFAFGIADAKQDLKVLEDELAKLNSNIDVDVNANIQDFSDKLSKSLNEVIETNAKSIQAFEKGIPEQLAELEDSIRQASEERIQSIEDAATLEQQNLQEGAALQFKLDQEEAKKKANLELTQSLARIQAEYDAGLISAEELDTLTKEMQLESATELQEEIDELALNSELELNASVEKLKLDTEQKIKEEKLAAEREIVNEKKKLEEELQAELKQLKIDSENEINELNKANEEEIRQRKLDLEAEIAGQRLDLEAQIAQQQNELNQQTQKSAGELLGSITGAVLNTFVPGIGGAAGQFVTLLSGSGEQLSAAIDSLFDAIPGVINNIADNLPVIITKLAENAGVIVGALAEAMPEVALALVKEAPSIALALINGIAEGLKGIINGIISVINELPGIDIPKLATGGTVPGGFANDTFPANLSSGEMVIPKDDVSRLSQFLDKQDSGGMSRADIDSVVKAIDKSSTKNVTVQIRLGENELANAILTLNRQGFRLA